MKKEQVAHCQFSVWYPLFRAVTIRSVILPLPENVKEYLLDDGTLVVSGREDPPTQTPEGSDDAEEIQWSDDENTATLKAPEFPEFTAKVEEAISSLGGSVFPKLNWSAPRDAYWIAMNSSLKCKALSDIFLLFKSSDFITRDLTQPFIHCTDDSPDPSLNYEVYHRGTTLNTMTISLSSMRRSVDQYRSFSRNTYSINSWMKTLFLMCTETAGVRFG